MPFPVSTGFGSGTKFGVRCGGPNVTSSLWSAPARKAVRKLGHLDASRLFNVLSLNRFLLDSKYVNKSGYLSLR